MTHAMNDYMRIARAIEFISSHVEEQPSLDEIARELNLSPFHFQRLFRQWAGITPKRFLQAQTVTHAKALLDKSLSVLDTTQELGLSSTARLHEHFVTLEAVTPGEYRSHGKALEIIHDIHETPFGQVLIAVTGRGICYLSFVDNNRAEQVADLRKKWHTATFYRSRQDTKTYIDTIFCEHDNPGQPLSLYVQGTNFQVQVWRALLRIPPGKVTTYAVLARHVGNPEATRAVGNAVGANPVAYLIPCHRVIKSSGAMGKYRWGSQRKCILLGLESARLE